MLVSFIVLYLLASIAIGLLAARRVHNTADYAVAGRTLPLAVVIATTFATWFGAETVLGAPARSSRRAGRRWKTRSAPGCAWCWWACSSRASSTDGPLTIGDYYRRRFGRTVEVLCSAIIISATWAGWARRSRRWAWCSTC
jgi:Na+/proline symporter